MSAHASCESGDDVTDNPRIPPAAADLSGALQHLPDRRLWQACLGDPARFAQAIVGVTPHAGQQEWLRNSVKPYNALITGNRWGKSFVAAVKALHRAIYQTRDREYDEAGRYRILTASITQDQASIIWNTILRLIDNSPLLSALVTDVSHSHYPKLTFGNASEVEARSTQNRGEYLLGNDYDYVIFDEVAFEPFAEYVVEEVMLMRLADRRGTLDLVSTPNGKNWLYRKCRELLTRPELGYVQFGDSRDNPHISADYLRERIDHFSPGRVAQNIMGQFIDSGREIITSAYVDRALARAGATAPQSFNRFVSGWDLARKRTATVGVTVGVTTDGTAHVVALERFTNTPWPVVFERIRARQRCFSGRLVIDATGLGDVALSELADLAPEGFIFNARTKAELLSYLEMTHARDRICYARWELGAEHGAVWALEDELRAATWHDNSSCDGVMALALALWPLRHTTPNEPLSPRLERI